jgi:diguanylate cyclase (GGDEF)-like protein/PAS domain S-box-containing protein
VGTTLLAASGPVELPFLWFVVGGLTVGIAVSNAAYLPAMIGFVAPSVAPFTFVTLCIGTPTAIAIALIAAACSSGLFWLSVAIGRGISGIAVREVAQAELNDSLRSRTQLLRAISVAAKELLSTPSIEMAAPTVLEAVGEAARVDRVLVFERQALSAGNATFQLRYGWRSPRGQRLNDAVYAAERTPEDPWFKPLAQGQVVSGFPTEMPVGTARSAFLALGIESVLIVPVIVDGGHWGHIGFDDCSRRRDWGPAEIDILRTVAELIGSAIVRQRHLEQLKNAKTIIEASPTILFRLRGDPLSLTYVSDNVTKYGYQPAEMMRGGWQTLVHPEDQERITELVTRLATEQKGSRLVEFRVRSKTGVEEWVECHYRPIRDADDRLIEIEGLLTDISDRKRAAEKIATLATTDSLTGLANRATFIDRLRHAFADARRGSPPFAMLYLDLDRFKEVNDTLGHPAGDSLLKSVSERLKWCTRETDFVARLGGDEFAILQTNMTDGSSSAVLASKICESLAAPYWFDGAEMDVTASIGISAYTPGVEPDEMLAQADNALYLAKEEGRNRYCFHSAGLDREAKRCFALANDMKQALMGSELELYFQPQIELLTGRIVGMEALLRWNHPRLGLLQPSQFLPMVEKTPISVALGQWVLDRACAQMSEWRKNGIAPQILAVNLTLKQLQTEQELVASVTRTLANRSLSPRDLELGVTESMLANVTLRRSDVLKRLQQLGVNIAIDDFGAQYSSLDYLKTYGVSQVKIPRSTLEAAVRDRAAATMVRATVSVAREYGIDVVAQGVETEAQRELLTCKPSPAKVQGYYYSVPVRATEATELLRRRFFEPRASHDERNPDRRGPIFPKPSNPASTPPLTRNKLV